MCRKEGSPREVECKTEICGQIACLGVDWSIAVEKGMKQMDSEISGTVMQSQGLHTNC
jgi:hypothetical protein